MSTCPKKEKEQNPEPLLSIDVVVEKVSKLWDAKTGQFRKEEKDDGNPTCPTEDK